jgi:hypothetical protein
MSLLLDFLMLAAPLFSWGDSLYLDAPRLGKVEDYAASGRFCHWVYTDIAVMERNSASRWVIGLRPVSLRLKPEIDGIVQNAVIDSVESDDLEELTTYWIGADAYPSQFYKGPWTKIDGLLARLAPSFTVDVKDAPAGGGTQAVHGTLYCGENAIFRSASGTYEIKAPAASAKITEYLHALADKDSITVDQLSVDGILYLQGSFPLFFYVMGGN